MPQTPPEFTEPLIDIGANLSHESFSDDLDAVLEQAEQAGIEKLVVTGTNTQSSHRAIELCEQFPHLLVSTVGLHPHEASSFNPEMEDAFRELARHDCVKAIGETGLDFNRNYSPHEDQEKAFRAQLALAVELNLPLFLHQRDAHERFMPILQEYRGQLGKVVVHCFTGSAGELEDYLDLDLHIGITGWVCDERRGYSLHPLLKKIPANRLMLETDAPYLMPRNISPKPKSRRNEPANLLYVLQMVADCLEMDMNSLAKQTSSTARDFFAL
ncbi:MAG: hydrolase TatD [Gammaproteobacteria bacterium]|nr:hydrolase TatD [Gammaproteobacteria bacterium]MAY01457.1 hydrolase TatD [Gammaproteobacteria bacterium]|tara:strand:- start:148436 stop:149248 length:813 start_codon:yes stop_codon:yes gene_type:complete